MLSKIQHTSCGSVLKCDLISKIRNVHTRYKPTDFAPCRNERSAIYVSSTSFLGNTQNVQKIKTINIHTEVSKKKIPSPFHLPIIGTTLSLLFAGGASKLHLYANRRHRKLGPIFKERLGNVEAVFISDPEYMRLVFANEGKYPAHVLPEAWILYNKLYGCSRGLLFMEKEEWLYYRRIMNNFLLKGDLNYITEATEVGGHNLINRIKFKEINLEIELYKWSLDTIIAVLLGNSYSSNKKIFQDKVNKLSETVHLIFNTSAKLQFVPATFAQKYQIKIWKDFVKAVYHAMVDANDIVYELTCAVPKNNGLLGLMMSSGMSKGDIIKIIVDLVLAAGDTTAYTMQWILYELAKHPEMQEQIFNDLEMDSLTSTKNFIKETLRLYPVAPFLTRFLPEDLTVGTYHIPKNTLILLSLFTSGRDGNIFPKPNSFIPDRWLEKTPSMSQASLPFAMGTRSCIGKKIAELQLQSTLVNIIKHYKVTMNSQEKIDIVLKMVAVPSKPLNINFIKR